MKKYINNEKTLLDYLSKMERKINEIIDKKTDVDGDHKGSWHGISSPTLTEEGLTTKVEELNESVEKIDNDLITVNSQLDQKAQKTDIVNLNNSINRTNESILEKETLLNTKINFIKDTELNINFFEGSTKEEKLINMITYANENGYKKVFVPSGTYDFSVLGTDTITLPEALDKIIIEGENARTTIFKYGHLQNKPFLRVKGGGGQMSLGYISNITFKGNSTTTGVQLTDICGYKIKDCIFSDNKIGVEFYNETGFTEYCVVEHCDFRSECISSVVYTKKTGNIHKSFHGCGLENCCINQNESSSSANIIIGTDCLIYNAPFNFTIWCRTDKPIIEHRGDPLSFVYGTIKVETFGSNYNQLVEGNELYLVGTMTSWGGYTKLDNVKLMETLNVINGGVKGKMKWNTRSKSLVQGDNELFACDTDYELNIEAIGDFYMYCGNFLIGKKPGADTIEITKLNEHSLFDQLSKGHIIVKGIANRVNINVPSAINNLNVKYTYRNLN